MTLRLKDGIALYFARHGETGATLFVITHDPELAGRCARVIELADGRITAERRHG